MKRTMLVVCTLALALCTASAWAAESSTPPADTLKVDYFANANTAGAPDGTVRLDNPGTAAGNVCANVYVFDASQELSECCSCELTPDGLRTLSVNTNLTHNPITGVTLTGGVIKLVSTTLTNGTCPTYPDNLNPTPALRAWATHIQNVSFAETETASQDATLSSQEVARLDVECKAIAEVGSGAGLCTCGSGD